MNLKACVFSLFALLSCQLSALETSDIYLRADVGHSLSSNPTDSAFDFGVGYRWNENFRQELTGTYRPSAKFTLTDNYGNKSPKRSFDNTSLMLNTFYDIGNYSDFIPYVGLGLGFYHNSHKDIIIQDLGESLTLKVQKSGVAVSFNAGCAYELTENLSLDLGLKATFLGHTEYEWIVAGHEEYIKHPLIPVEMMIGVVYQL